MNTQSPAPKKQAKVKVTHTHTTHNDLFFYLTPLKSNYSQAKAAIVDDQDEFDGNDTYKRASKRKHQANRALNHSE